MQTDMPPLKCTGSCLSVDGTILSHAAETLRAGERNTLGSPTLTHRLNYSACEFSHQWITRKCLTLIMHVLRLHPDFFFFNIPTDFRDTDGPSCLKRQVSTRSNGSATQHFPACGSVKCLLHWFQLKCLQSLAPECLLLLLPYCKWDNSVQIIQSILVFLFL